MVLTLFVGIMFGYYDSMYKSHHQLCLSILKEFGFGQRVMETRILIEVEEMISKVKQMQGRPFDIRQLFQQDALEVNEITQQYRRIYQQQYCCLHSGRQQ